MDIFVLVLELVVGIAVVDVDNEEDAGGSEEDVLVGGGGVTEADEDED